MSLAQKFVLGISVILTALALLDYFPSAKPLAEFLRLSQPVDAFHLACALWGYFSLFLGVRASTVYLVCLGLMLAANGVAVCFTGVSLPAVIMGVRDIAPFQNRLIIGIVYIATGVCALGVGGSTADRIQDETNIPPPP